MKEVSFFEDFIASLRFAKEIMFHPNEATKETATDRELFYYLFLILLIPSVVIAAIMMLDSFMTPTLVQVVDDEPIQPERSPLSFFRLGNELFGLFDGLWNLLLIPIYIASAMFGVLVGALIIHVIGKLFRTYKFNYSKTLTAMIFAQTPVAFFGWIPFVNFAVIIWSFIIAIFALSNQQQITKMKALISLIIPAVIIPVVFVGIIIALSGTAFLYITG